MASGPTTTMEAVVYPTNPQILTKKNPVEVLTKKNPVEVVRGQNKLKVRNRWIDLVFHGTYNPII